MGEMYNSEIYSYQQAFQNSK